MHSALIVVQVAEEHPRWMNFIGNLKPTIVQTKGVVRLSENVWLVNLEISPTPLAHIISLAEQQKLLYGILPLAAAPQWLPGGFDPTSILGQSAR